MPLSKQQIFDKVVNHLDAQRKQCKQHTTCSYRNDDGMKCAIGALIDDCYYSPTIEGLGANNLKVWELLNLSGVYHGEDSTICNILSEMQNIHDSYLPNEWKKQFNIIAIRHSLNLDSSKFDF